MSDTPTAALAADALQDALLTSAHLGKVPNGDFWWIARDTIDVLTEQGWSLVPSGSLLDMARATQDEADGKALRLLRDAYPAARLIRCDWLPEHPKYNEGPFRVKVEWWSADGTSGGTSADGETVAAACDAIAAAREMVAAEPGT